MAGCSELAKIALRNLARHRVKTVLTVLAIMVSVALYIFADSWITGMSMESRRNIVNYEMGAAKLQTKLYFEKKDEMPSYESFANWEVLLEILDKAGYNAAPRFVFSGTMFSLDGSAPVVFNAVDPVLDAQILRYAKYVEPGPLDLGRYIQSGNFEIVVGAFLADKLKLTQENNNVQISATIDIKDEDGKVRHIYQVISAVVVGVINSPNPVTNANIAYIPLDVLQGEEGMMLEGHITEILIRDKNAKDSDLPGKRESAASIAAALGNNLPAKLKVFTWKDYSADYLGYEKMEAGATKILTMLLFVLALLGISNTILMSILERTKEIGMMRALGMTDNQLILVYMFEAGFLGLLGSVLGIILGCAINYPVVEYGIDFGSMREPMGATASFRIAALFRSTWDVPTIIGTGVVATLVSSFMAIFPARRATKMPITDSLRFE